MEKRISLRDRIARRARRGSVMVVTALTIPVAAGFAGLGVDVGLWETNKRSLQTAADAAAISGAIERVRGHGGDALRASALHEAGRNGFVSGTGTSHVINNPPTTGSYAGDPQAVEVYLSRPERPLLASLVFGSSVTLAVRAVATMQASGTACVLSLHPTAPGAATIWGSTTVNLPGCVIASNSNSSTAIDIGGSATLNAASLWTAGDVSEGGSSDVNLQAAPRTHVWPIPDPFASTPMPGTGGCGGGNNFSTNVSITINPGVYCNGMTFGSQAVVTMNPGTYVINRGDLTIHGGAVVRCSCPNPTDGVTIVLTSSGSVNQIGSARINGGADVNLTAPSGVGDTYRGMVLIQDPRAPTNGVSRLNGGANMILKGAIYFPGQEVEWTGNNTQTNCIEIVAREVTFTGNSYLDVSGCAAMGTKTIQLTVAKVIE